MGAPYTATSVSNYNSNPPSDDGATTDSNKVKWSTQKTKLTDPLKTAFDSSETATVAGFGKVFGGAGFTNTGVNYTVLSGDQGKEIRATASGVTITTPDATSVGSPFMFAVQNASTGTITVAGSNPGVQQNVDGSASIIVQPGCGAILNTNGTDWFTVGPNFVKPNPPPASYKNLSIKVATNTTVALAADFIVVTDGSGSFQTLAYSKTIDLGTTGANSLDTGTIAIDTWYAIWAIAKADGTTAGLASTSASAPTMPAGYTYKARVGWVRTIHASATLFGTWQLGRRAQYVVGLAQTTTIRLLASGNSGAPGTPTWTAIATGNFVPTTASIIKISVTGTQATQGRVICAPNNSYGNYASTTNGPPIIVGFTANQTENGSVAEFLLESTNIYYASDLTTGTALVACLGWEDNI